MQLTQMLISQKENTFCEISFQFRNLDQISDVFKSMMSPIVEIFSKFLAPTDAVN